MHIFPFGSVLLRSIRSHHHRPRGTCWCSSVLCGSSPLSPKKPCGSHELSPNAIEDGAGDGCPPIRRKYSLTPFQAERVGVWEKKPDRWACCTPVLQRQVGRFHSRMDASQSRFPFGVHVLWMPLVVLIPSCGDLPIPPPLQSPLSLSIPFMWTVLRHPSRCRQQRIRPPCLAPLASFSTAWMNLVFIALQDDSTHPTDVPIGYRFGFDWTCAFQSKGDVASNHKAMWPGAIEKDHVEVRLAGVAGAPCRHVRSVLRPPRRPWRLRSVERKPRECWDERTLAATGSRRRSSTTWSSTAATRSPAANGTDGDWA